MVTIVKSTGNYPLGILVAGTRTPQYNNNEHYQQWFERKVRESLIDLGIEPNPISRHYFFISGMAKSGADYHIVQSCLRYNIKYESYPADWQKNGKRAGILRNIEMLLRVKETHGAIICFWDGQSHGTKNTIDTAKKMNIPTKVIYLSEYQQPNLFE